MLNKPKIPSFLPRIFENTQKGWKGNICGVFSPSKIFAKTKIACETSKTHCGVWKFRKSRSKHYVVFSVLFHNLNFHCLLWLFFLVERERHLTKSFNFNQLFPHRCANVNPNIFCVLLFFYLRVKFSPGFSNLLQVDGWHSWTWTIGFISRVHWANLPVSFEFQCHFCSV